MIIFEGRKSIIEAEDWPDEKKKLEEGAIYVGPGACTGAVVGNMSRGGSGEACFSVGDLWSFR